MKKLPPNFWWDFVDNATAIIVQSDWPGGEELARFTVKDGNAESCIEQAGMLIEDFKAGRKTPNWHKG